MERTYRVKRFVFIFFSLHKNDNVTECGKNSTLPLDVVARRISCFRMLYFRQTWNNSTIGVGSCVSTMANKKERARYNSIFVRDLIRSIYQSSERQCLNLLECIANTDHIHWRSVAWCDTKYSCFTVVMLYCWDIISLLAMRPKQKSETKQNKTPQNIARNLHT